MTPAGSALYVGAVEHIRLRPRRHRLRYRMFQMLFDLGELEALDGGLRLFSVNRSNLYSLFERDHGDGRARDLRGWAVERLAEAGIDIGAGRVSLLCMPRVLGHVFNPISVYFCCQPDKTLAAMLYEVNNTFGQRHNYVIPVDEPPAADGVLRQSCAKAFHVSPFLPMAMRYDFQIASRGETLSTIVDGADADGEPLIHARFTGARRPMTDRALASLLISHPLLTLKVVAAIHLEALRLLMKGLRPQPRPPSPTTAVSVMAESNSP